MTQYFGPLISDIVKAGEVLDRQPVPDRDQETIGLIIKAHMPVEEMKKEASNKDD